MQDRQAGVVPVAQNGFHLTLPTVSCVPPSAAVGNLTETLAPFTVVKPEPVSRLMLR